MGFINYGMLVKYILENGYAIEQLLEGYIKLNIC